MKTDANPSIMFGLYCKPKRFVKLLEDLDKLGVNVRLMIPIDVEIPLDRKDEVINHFKHFINPYYWDSRLNSLKTSFTGKLLIKQIKKKTGYKPIDFSGDMWRNDTIHPLLYTLACPLFVQDTSGCCETKEEKKAMEDLFKFKSKGYKPKLNISKD